MPNKSVTYQDVYKLIDDARKETEHRFNSLEDKLDRSFVTKEEFKPLQTILYGIVGVFMTGVIGAILSLVLVNR